MMDVVWVVDDQPATVRDHCDMLVEHDVRVEQVVNADHAMRQFKQWKDDGGTSDLDLLVLDMKMKPPKEPAHLERLSTRHPQDDSTGSYLLEDFRKWHHYAPILILSQFSASKILNLVWGCYVQIAEGATDPGRGSVESDRAVLRDMFGVSIMQKGEEDWQTLYRELALMSQWKKPEWKQG